MDRPGWHPLGLRAALCTANALSPVCRQRPLSVPLLPPTLTNCASRRDQSDNEGGCLPRFPLETFLPPVMRLRRCLDLDYTNAATHQQQPLRHAGQLRLTPLVRATQSCLLTTIHHCYTQLSCSRARSRQRYLPHSSGTIHAKEKRAGKECERAAICL